MLQCVAYVVEALTHTRILSVRRSEAIGSKLHPSLMSKETNGWGDNVHVSSHPIIAHKITILRSSATANGTFRAVLKEVTYHLGYEATTSLTTKPVNISVPSAINKDEHVDWKGKKLVEHVALIPILRSGLGMVDSMLELVPNAQVHHIGMYRTKGEDSTPVLYYNRLPRNCQSDIAYVMDAMIATSSTLMSVVGILKKWGVKKIHVMAVIASKKGLEQLTAAHPDVSITVGEIDEIGDNGQLLPGLGDSGDRLFGTAQLAEDDESLLHPSRRKRTLSEAE